jgi:hypothetical protein
VKTCRRGRNRQRATPGAVRHALPLVQLPRDLSWSPVRDLARSPVCPVASMDPTSELLNDRRGSLPVQETERLVPAPARQPRTSRARVKNRAGSPLLEYRGAEFEPYPNYLRACVDQGGHGRTG